MENQANTSLTNAVNSNQRQESVIPTDGFNFIPIEEMFDGPETQIADVLATDPGAIANVGAYKSAIDRYGIPAMASLGVARPTLATGTFDPVAQQNPPQDTYNTVSKILKAESKGPAADVVDKRFANIRQSNFMRYYEHPDFAQLGFTPYADMEGYYNANSTIWDDMSRMRGEFSSLVGSGFSSVYRSLGDMFDDDAYFSAPDIDSAMEFEDAMAIGNSTRGGALAFTNNLLLNSGYTFGIIGSIAVEELILAGATYLSGGATSGLAAVRTAQNAGRIVKGAKNFFNIKNMQASTRALLNQLKNYDAAKSFWAAAKSGTKVVGNILTPQTYSALKNFKTAKNATQNANNLAKAKAGFGGFYRDFRAVNLALAESKLEGGMVYNELVREGVDIQKKKTGNVTPEQMALIQSQAGEGAFYTTMTNAPLIFLSNQIVLGNAMGGFNRSLGRVFNDTFKKGLNGRLFKGKGVKDAVTGKIKDVFEDAGPGIRGWWTKVKAGGIKGNTGMAISATARYFAANVAEGLQEIGQEAIAVGTKGYYTTVMEDPLSGGIALQNDMIRAGMGSQFSGQGVETFLSGFLMGGIVQGPQKLVFQGMPALYNRISDPKAFKEYQETKKNYVKDLVKVHNEAWNSSVDNPSSLFDLNELNFKIQKQVAGAMKENAFAQDRFGFTDEKDFGKFQQLYTIFSNGTSNYFRTQLTDFMQMSDEELGQAFPGPKSDIKNGKARERLQKMINNLDKFELSFEKNKDKFTNPYDRTQYDKGSRAYILEAIKEKAFEHITYLQMFTEDGFKRATERQLGIYTKLSNEPLFEGMAANDITVLLDIDSINNEIGLLLQDIAVQDKETSEGKKAIEKATNKIKNLSAIEKILNDPKNLTKDGSFDRRKINKLTSAFEKYVQFMANSTNSFVDRSKMQDALKEIVDYKALNGRAKVYDKAIEYLNNPQRLSDIVDRQIEVNKNIYKNLSKIHKQQIEKYINIKEANVLMNKLFEAGYVGDPEQVKKFLISGNVNELKNFYDDQGDIDPNLDKVKYDQIQRLLETYRSMSEKTDESTDTTEEKGKDVEVKETKNNQDEILEDANIDVILPDANNSILLQKLLDRQYRKYSGTQTVLGETVKTFEEWRNTEGLNWQNSFNALKKLWISGKLPVMDAKGNPIFTELSDADIKAEAGFDQWLRSREVLENPLVRDILQAAGIPLNEMYYTEPVKSDPTLVTPKVANEDDEDNIDPANPPKPRVFQEGTIVDVLKITTFNSQGEVEAFFKLVDKNGNNVSPELLLQIGITRNAFNNSGTAIASMRKLDKRAPDSTPFPFDGVMLFQGQLVYDSDGKEYRVISTPKFVQGGNLRLVPNNFEGKPVTLQSGQFKNSYTTQEIKFDLLPSNVARVNITDINKVYPHANTDENGKRDYEGADDRLNIILDNLTQEEINTLELVINVNNEGGNNIGNYVIKGKEQNPYVTIVQSKYSIGLSIPNGKIKNRINKILKDNGVPITDNADGIFAYIPNGNIQIKDVTSLANMSREQALNSIFVSPELKATLDQKQTLELVRNNFALNALLLAYADSNPKSVIGINQLPFGLNFITQKGGRSIDNSNTRSLKDLRYEHADENGSYFIFDLKRKKGSRTIEYITTAEENVKLYNKIKSRLQKDLMWDNIITGSDRYVAIVQLPDGSYRPINLKARSLTKDQRGSLAVDLVERAQKTKKENLDKDGKVKDEAYNRDFNDTTVPDKVFISSNSDYNISLQVSPWGKLQLQLFDKNTSKQVGQTITIDIPAANSTSFVNQNSATGFIQSLIKDFNNDADIKATKVTLSNKNFRESFPTATSANEIIDLTTTNVRPEVVLNSSARATGESSAIQAEIDKGNIKEDVVENTEIDESNFTSEEAEFSLLDLSDLAFAEFAAKDFLTLPSEFINHIANKIVKEGVDNLTSREVEVYNMRAATINVMVSQRGGEGLQQTSGVEAFSRVEGIYTFEQKNIKGGIVNQIIKNNENGSEIIKATSPDGSVKFFLIGKFEGVPNQMNGLATSQKEIDAVLNQLGVKAQNFLGLNTSEQVSTSNPNQKFDDAVSTIEEQIQALRDPVTSEVADKDRAKFQSLITKLYEAKRAASRGNSTQPLGTKTKNKDVDGSTIYYGKEAKAEEDNSIENYIKIIEKSIKNGKITQEVGRQMVLNRINKNYDFTMDKMGIIVDYIQDRLDDSIPQVGNNKSSWQMFRDGKQPATQQINNLEDIKQQLETVKTQLLEGVAPKDRGKTLRTSEEYQKLLAQRKAIEKEANKIMSSSDFSLTDVEDIDVFTDWAANNLPGYMNISDITTLGNNLKAGGVRVGAFVLGLNHVAGGQKVSGTIYTGALSPYKYHEAFHGVFRMLLSDEEIKRYRNIARKEVRAKLRAEGKSFEKELQKFKNSADTYSNMTRQELENQYYEEYLADEFNKFKINPKNTNTDASVKSLFTRILDWIQSVFNSYSKNELRTLFENIDSGKFKGAQIANNEFTTALNVGATIEANALIPYNSITEKGNLGFIYLESDIADPLVRNISAMFLQRVSKLTESYNPKNQMDSVLDDFEWLYSIDNPINENKTDLQKVKLNEIQSAFDNYSATIREQSIAYINQISDKSDNERYEVEEFEDATGIRSTTEYEKDASMIGGFRSLSSQLRAYIATTSVEATDYFGNVELTNGEPLIIAVDFVEAYNGLLKAVKNLTDPKQILQSMYFFGQDNSETGAIVQRILNDVGITKEQLLKDNGIPTEIQSPLLFQSILKGFENFRVDYLFNERDNAGNTIVYSASERDDVNSQLDRWNQGFISKRKQLIIDPKRKDLLINLLSQIQKDILPTDKAITSAKLKKDSKKYSQELFELSGIKISPLFLQYSMLYNRTNLKEDQSVFLKLNKNESAALTHDLDGSAYKESSIALMNQLIQSNEDIFSVGKDGMDSRLKNMSIANAPFDETIGASVFKNPNGDLIYAHQLPTYHLKKIAQLNNPEALVDLLESDPYLANNYLLNSSAFKQLSLESRLQVIRVAGNKIGDLISTEEELNDGLQGIKQTSTYGDFTPQEFALNLINNYGALLNSKSYKVSRVESLDREGNKIISALAPILIRVMEASNTGDMAALPVIKTVEMVNGEAVLTEEAVDIYIDKIRTEFARINREANDITKTQEDILGYTDGRALTFFNTKTLMSVEQQTFLINAAIKAGKAGNIITLDDALAGTVTQQTSEVTDEVSGMTALRNNLVDNLESRFQVFEQLIDELKIEDQISNQVKNGPVIAAGVSRGALVQSASLLNLNNNFRHNLKQIFFNDAINSYSINEILLGDQAVSLKDSVDQIKRAKMQNGAYYSAYSAITAPEHGVIHPVDDISLVTLTEPQDSGIDFADAQMYITTKAFRYMWFGFGKLSAAQAEFINRIEAGQTITSDSVFGNEATPEGYAKMQALLNSKKLVYGDGSTFLKMSAFTLTPQYTSEWNDDIKSWVALPGKETLHNLRLKLEAIEKEKETIAIAAPLSAVKMKKQRVNLLEELDNTDPFTNGVTTLDARFMGLQQLNPSNKLEQIDPTQIKQILTSEQNDKQFVPALNMSVKEIRTEYNKAISQRVTLKFNDKTNLIFSFENAMDELSISQASGKITPKLAAFLQFALSGLKASQSSSQILEFFSMTEGIPNYNLNNQIIVRKFEQLFLSYFSKGVFSERTPGLGLTLVSDFGNKVYRRVFEIKDGVPIRSEIIRRAAWQGTENDLFNIDSLTQENIGPAGVVVLDRLRHGIMEYDSNGEPTGQRYTEMMMPAHHKSVMDLIENTPSATMPEAISKMFGVRIPSQDNHSAMNIKWVDFMPVFYGSSAMFARELVEVSGADFDIDKVFAQFKDFYVKDGEFFEYGNKNKLEENYSDYIRYINANVNKSGTIYSEAYLTYDENLDAAKIENSLTESEEKAYYQFLTKQNIVTDAGLKEAGVKALQLLGLPITKAQYGEYVAKFGEPYAAPLNNKILDYKYALLGNDSVASGENPISYSPAALDILNSTLADLAEVSDIFKNRMLEENNDVDDLVGKILAFKANKGASIGAAVLPNLYLSLLTEYKIDLKSPIIIDGVTYDSFKYTTEKKNEGDQRNQDTISSLITMATDNAKERLFAKLGLNRHALGLVSMMTSLSIPIKTSILLINNPVIQDLYSQALNKKDKFDPGIDTLVEKEYFRLIDKVKKETGTLPRGISVTNAVLLDAINFPGEVTDEVNISILQDFKQLADLKQFTDKMGAPTSLTKGLGKDVATVLDKKKDIQDLLSEDAPLDLNKIYNSNTWYSTYLKLFKQVTDYLLPATFLSAAPVFQDILNNVVDNIDTRATTLKTEDVQNIALDLLSYLNIKGYQYNLLQNGTLNEKVLSNDLIYPNSDRSIVDVINEIKEVLESKGESNFFIDNFVIPESATDVGNDSGLNIAMANTFRNLSAPQKVDLQNSFAQLYGSLDTKNQAQTIINYMMVKDGLQLRYGSLLEAIAPFTMNKFLSHINTVEKAVRGDVSFESVFGLSKEELTKEFTEGFLESNINGSKLWTFKRSLTTGSLQPGVQVKDNEVTVNWASIVLDRDATPNYVRVVDVQGVIKTYKLDSESKTYKEIDPFGSNQQTHIGFMFGPRPTYKEIRAFVNSKNGKNQEDPYMDFAMDPSDFAVQQEVLQSDNVNIEATENSIDVQLDPEATMTNVADTAFLLEQLGLNQEAQDQSELEANVIDDVDTSLPEVDEVEGQLTLDFGMELDEQFPMLTDFWDSNIQGNKEAMASLRENNILSLEDFIEEYNNGIYENEEGFIDQIKKCNL